MRWLVGAMIALLPQAVTAAQLSGFYKGFAIAFDSPQAGVPVIRARCYPSIHAAGRVERTVSRKCHRSLVLFCT